MRKGQEKKYKLDKLTIPQWAADNERYIRENNTGNLCYSAQSIFIVESDKIVWKGVQDVSFQVVVSSCTCRLLYTYCKAFL